MEKKIETLLSNNAALPVLFVGSGLTRRYLDLPDWENLLRNYCIKPFEYYFDIAKRNCRDNPDMILPTVADYIEADFNEKWYTDDSFSESRNEHKEEMKKKISPFKICIADFFRNASNNVIKKYSKEVELLSEIGSKNISSIITTNYDCFLEKCFGNEQFHTYIGQDDLLFSTTYDIGELYKIHGCCTRAETIVINADDYKKIARKSAYLSSKLLTIFLEHPIIFLGYSINDSDIKQILDSIADCLEDYQLNQLSERLIFVEYNLNGEQDDAITERRITTKSGKTINMKNVLIRDYSCLYRALLQNQAKYDIRILRRIKSQLYELVQQNKPTEKLYVATDIEDDHKTIDFVVGIGAYGKFAKVGYRGIKAEELYLYAINRSELQYDDAMILKEAIPALYNGRSPLPVCQLISKCMDEECLNEKVRMSVKPDFNSFLSPGERQLIKKGYFKMNSTICEYYRINGLSKTLSKIPLLSQNSINPKDLIAFINQALDDEPTLLATDGRTHPFRSQFKKSISIWDWLMYYNEAKKKIESFDTKGTSH